MKNSTLKFPISFFFNLPVLVFIFCTGINTYAQVSLSTMGSPYNEDFNTLINTGNATWTDNSTLAGWYKESSNSNIYADDGNDVFGGRFTSYGTVSSSERCMGGKSFSSLSGITFGVRLTNNTGGIIDSISISYTGEQWRRNTTSQTMVFEYQVGAVDILSGTWTPITQLDFPTIHSGSATALDGNLLVNQMNISYTFPATVNNGQEIWVRWVLIEDSNSPGLGIDDLSITPLSDTVIPPPTPLISVDTSMFTGNFGTILVGTSSAEQSYEVSGTDLLGDISIVPPTGFEISTGTGAGFVPTNPIILPEIGGIVSATPIYVRFTPPAAGPFSGNIIHSSPGAINVLVPVNGTGYTTFGTQMEETNYPSLISNFSQGLFNLVVPGIEKAMKINITTLNGTIVHEQNFDPGVVGSYPIDLSSQPSGMYLLSISDETGVRKVIKMVVAH